MLPPLPKSKEQPVPFTVVIFFTYLSTVKVNAVKVISMESVFPSTSSTIVITSEPPGAGDWVPPTLGSKTIVTSSCSKIVEPSASPVGLAVQSNSCSVVSAFEPEAVP